MEYKKLKEYWLSEEKKSFQGWDFSYIEKRETHEPLPWDYDKFVRQYLNSNSILLDMGTGGGEYLLTLNHPYFKTFATEAYLPNFELCERTPVSYTHLRAHETRHDLVCRLLLEKKKK